ncbi:serine hydrolase domain-containing protein [Streptomyces griseomycini]|uniref:D-alanyl-D-alanine carboxypeptidase n=1 Tax=Streptomyces griseomycini TaxID=66895 RepID=A0A7W7LUR9_9ACTN|nr:serine hydrolase domain-containing protein [Streptomyces griseomycini]MBB4896844.1 D-alanyl-D-alanine carboxypeptidase [Streptomyces griseomycini]GGR15040.1 D-alanyl-D-alanine carboxypeptidase [Streptomyces griseomycini]
MRMRTTAVAAVAVALSAVLAAPAVAAPGGSGAGTGDVTGADTGDHRAAHRAMRAAVAAGVPGVTATAKDRRGTWAATAGVGDLRTERKRSPHDRYRIGSITKTFVATVLLQLEAEGKLSLDDTVDTWLPGLVTGNGHDGTRITLRQLLNHTSGVFNYTADEDFGRTYFLKDGFFEHRYDTLAPEDLVRVALAHEPDFEPGTDWNYSNTNYVLAGMVIEKATGRPYGEEVRRRIVDPLHLTATSVPGTRAAVPGPSSRAYSKLTQDGAGPTYDVTRLNPSLAHSAGEMISDSKDLNRFYRALLTGRLLPREQLNAMTTTVPVGSGQGYGLGLMKSELSCGVTVWGHGGGIHGSLSEAVTTENGRHSLAFNFNGDWAGDTGAVIEAEFCGD